MTMRHDPKIQSCASCAYYSDNGLCLRNPPTMIGVIGNDGMPTAGRLWPQMQPEEICGQWAPDADTQRKLLQRQAFGAMPIGGTGQ